METLLNTAIEAAIEGGKAILKIYNGQFDVTIKEDLSPVTIADLNSNEKILAILENTGIPVLSEESENLPYSERMDWQRFWLVDPLDGTRQFIKRNDEFTVNIALVDKDLGPIMGILYLPVSGKLYFSRHTEGAYRTDDIRDLSINEIIDESVKLSGSNEETVRIAVNRSSSASPQNQAFMNEVASRHKVAPEVIVAGSALKFGWIAEGRAQYYPRFKPSMEWDTAAGHAIVKEVGYTVVDANTKKELQYNKSSLLNPSFIVCKPEYL